MKARKIKHETFYTRAKSLRLMKNADDLNVTFTNDKGMVLRRFADHPNYHVRSNWFHRMGRPYPQDLAECAKLCKDLRIKDPNVVVVVEETAVADKPVAI